MRNLKACIAVTVIVCLFGLGVVRPRAARANTGTGVAIGLAGFAAYVLIVFGFTKLVFKAGNDTTSAQDPLTQYEAERQPVRFTQNCRQDGGAVTVACW